MGRVQGTAARATAPEAGLHEAEPSTPQDNADVAYAEVVRRSVVRWAVSRGRALVEARFDNDAVLVAGVPQNP